jgi:large subunit ribosomal protein L21
MRYAIIQSGGKQYKAVEGETLEVDNLTSEPGKKVELGDVLLVSDGDAIHVGTPLVDGAKVAATVVEHGKGPKLTVFKYKPKIRYRVKTGHRQQLTRLMIDSIALKGETRSKPASEAAPKAEAKAAAPKPAARKKTAAKKSAAKKSKK